MATDKNKSKLDNLKLGFEDYPKKDGKSFVATRWARHSANQHKPNIFKRVLNAWLEIIFS